jgi:pimeloyl-ACP methyl ester carboxylesterase
MKKPSLVLIPGLGGDAEAWEHQIQHLKDIVDCKAIILDKENSRAAMAERILRESPSQFHLAGHSLGGWVAQEVAAREPKRVQKLILLNTWSLPNPKINEMQKEAIQKIERGKFKEVLKELIPKIIHPSRLNDRELVLKIQNIQMRMPSETYCRQLQAMINDYSTLSLLPKIESQTLIVQGREDALFSLEEQQTLAKNITHARLAIIEDCGHASILERPQAVTALMRFWLTE